MKELYKQLMEYNVDLHIVTDPDTLCYSFVFYKRDRVYRARIIDIAVLRKLDTIELESMLLSDLSDFVTCRYIRSGYDSYFAE